MALIRAKTGADVTVGKTTTAPGYQHLQTYPEHGQIRIADPGIPLRDYPAPTDPVSIWENQPAVRKVVSFVASKFSAIPWHAYQRTGDNDRRRMADSPLETIFEDPQQTGLVTGTNFWEHTITDRLLYDMQLAIYTEQDGLVRIPPHLVRIASDRLGRPREIYLRGAAGEDDIEVTAVPKIFTYGWSGSKAGGISPMKTLADILNENTRAIQWRTQQWTNGPKISGILKRPADARAWRNETRERFEREWAAWRDSEKGGGTPILEDGMEYEQLNGLNPKDANDIEGRQLTDIEVASAFHIPPELIGAREGTYSNIAAFREMLYGPTLGPLFESMRQAVKIGGLVRALDTRKNIYVEPNREAGMAGSFWEQIRYLQTAVGGPFMTQAEGRGLLNLPYLPGTDELIRPLNVVQGGQASPRDSGDQNIGGDNADPDAREQ